MPAYIHQIETSVPEFSYRQDELRDKMKSLMPEGSKEQRLLHHVYNHSGIDFRHSVVNDFRLDSRNELFFNGDGKSPSTESRNNLFVREARKLFTDTAQQLLTGSEMKPSDITHLITVSCTGFYAPGPDFDIIQKLGLNPATERYHLGFMGCYAVLPALKMAHQLCLANEHSTVMIVSAELCTLHFQATPLQDDLISASVFADGAAGAIVSSQKPDKPSFRLHSFHSNIAENSEKEMAWSIGNSGFHMVLSTYVPSIIQNGVSGILRELTGLNDMDFSDIDLWAIHPGGRAILDAVENGLDLPESALHASRTTLSQYGNMSSATILFVLKKILDAPSNKMSELTAALAFGPGLTIETAILEKLTP